MSADCCYSPDLMKALKAVFPGNKALLQAASNGQPIFELMYPLKKSLIVSPYERFLATLSGKGKARIIRADIFLLLAQMAHTEQYGLNPGDDLRDLVNLGVRTINRLEANRI